MIGDELAYSPQISKAEKFYIRLFGVPISGLRIRLRRVLPHLSGTPGKALDAGCGRGIFSYRLAKHFPNTEVVAVDIDDEQLKSNTLIATRVGLKNLTFVKESITELSFDKEFDLVLSVDNLEHLEDDQKGLDSLYQALKPQGRLILHVPGYERRWLLFKFQTNFDVPGHFRPGYYIDDIKAKVTKTGFTIEQAYYTFGWFETITNNISYLITRAEAKNKLIYAGIFPLLNAIAWLGRNAHPKKGAGVLIIAHKTLLEQEI